MEKGSKGNKTGNVLESTVVSVLQKHGFTVVPYKAYRYSSEEYRKEVLLTNVPYQTIYDHKGKTEFLLISERLGLKIRIECKWQQSSGSVDEKLPYLYLNALRAMPEDKIMIIIDGKGWKEGAIQWLKNAVNTKKYADYTGTNKEIMVFTLMEFLTWANNTFSI